jgi:hypothetical protein
VGRTGRPRVARGERDLDLGGKVTDTEQRLLRVLQRARDAGDRRVDLALCKA